MVSVGVIDSDVIVIARDHFIVLYYILDVIYCSFKFSIAGMEKTENLRA